MKVYVTGETEFFEGRSRFTLEVEPSHTILDVKTQIQEETEIRPEDQQLVFVEELLEEDGRALIDYNIQAESELRLRITKRFFTITVKTDYGKSFPFTVHKTASVIDLKHHVLEKEGVSFQNQTLIYGGLIVLEESKDLRDYNITDDATVDLVLRFISIEIVLADKRMLTLQMGVEKTIGEIKLHILKEKQIQVNRQHLTYEHVDLEDEETLSSYRLTPQVTIELIQCDGQHIMIFVQNVDRKMIALRNLHVTDKVEKVKELLFGRTGVPIHVQRLLCRMMPMEDEGTLMDYNLEQHSTLQLAGHMRGGSNLRLNISMPDQRIIALKINEVKESIDRIKKMIFDKEGIPVSEQVLLDKTLAELRNDMHDTEDNTTLTLVHEKPDPNSILIFEIEVKPASGVSHLMKVWENETILALKKRLQYKFRFDVPAERQELIHDGTTLQDGYALSDYQIREGPIYLQLLPETPGGFVQIFVDIPSGMTSLILVDTNLQIKDLKLQIQEHMPGILVSCLYQNGKELEDCHTLEYYNITTPKTSIQAKAVESGSYHDDGDKDMQIFVNVISGETRMLKINSMDTIATVKTYLKEIEGISANKQKLYYGGNQLDDEHTISYYVSNDTVLDMIPNSQADKKWSEEEKKSLSAMSAMCVIFVGDKNAGKSSLVNTILKGSSYTAHKDDRTVVADLSHWKPPGKQNTIFTFVDCGGHHSYRVTGQYFHRNSTNNVAVLCHDTLLDDPAGSFVWVKSVLTGSPKCHIRIVLTKSDQLNENNIKNKKNNFIKLFIRYLQDEMRDLSIMIQNAHSSNNKKISQFKQLRDKYSWLIQHIEDIVVVTSCIVGYIESIEPLTEALIHLADDPNNQVLLPEHIQMLYMHIGKQGTKVTCAILGMQSITDSVSARYALEKIKISFHKVKSFMRQIVKTKIVKPKLDAESQLYLKLSDIMPVYEDILQNLGLPSDNIEERLRCSLTYLHYHGLLMFFLGGEHLKKVVFHDMRTVLKIFKSVFNHNVSESLEMKTQRHRELLSDHFNNNEQEFVQDSKLSKQGLLSQSLVAYLLAVNGCSIRVEVVVQLLEILATGFSFIPENMSNQYLFIPFYVKDKQSNPEIEQLVANMEVFEKDQLSLHCRLKGNLPATFWNYLVVQLLKQLRITMQTQHLWGNGFWATVGKNNAKVLLLCNRPEQVDFFVKGDITDLEGHATVWKYIRILSEETDRLVHEWWPGLITGKTLVCTHCRLLKLPTSSEHDLDQILGENDLDSCACDYSSNIPAAMLMPLAQGSKTDKLLNQTVEYINNTLEQDVRQTGSEEDPSDV